jgi:hypothetical protein
MTWRQVVKWVAIAANVLNAGLMVDWFGNTGFWPYLPYAAIPFVSIVALVYPPLQRQP